MKKLILILLAGILVFAISCGGGPTIPDTYLHLDYTYIFEHQGIIMTLTWETNAPGPYTVEVCWGENANQNPMPYYFVWETEDKFYIENAFGFRDFYRVTASDGAQDELFVNIVTW